MSGINDIIQQVSALEDATTQLLNATNVAKKNLDDAVVDAGSSKDAAAENKELSIAAREGAEAAKDEAVAAREGAEAAKDEAVAAREGAEAAKDEAVTAREGAEAAKDEAVTAREGAEAAKDEQLNTWSETAAPNKLPLADSNGHLDVNWTPLLAAMYPYSGVIGSVDKGNVFYNPSNITSPNTFSITNLSSGSSAANRFTEWNINGRYVRLRDTSVTLPAAESTADRAVAFDDIFLDWNGNVVTHRSITAHRTTTGYDADAIATEHGYTKVQNGLYRTSDSATYLLILGRVARRNKGAYHPLYNPEGSAKFNVVAADWSGTYDAARRWFDDITPTAYESVTGCFTNYWPSSKSVDHSGSIGDSAAIDSRPDGKFYDAIYADDFTPLYYSAKNVVDRQALLFDSFNWAVAGETFMGAEGGQYADQLVPQANYPSVISSFDPSISIASSAITATNAPQVGAFARIGIGDVSGKVQIRVEYDLTITSGSYKTILVRSDGTQTKTPIRTANGSYVDTFSFSETAEIFREIYFDADVSNTSFTITNLKVYINEKRASARPQFLAVDIIGNTSAMPNEWLTEGIPGNWLSVDEDGGSLIPDGTSKNYKLSRKCLECYLALRTTDNGATYTDETSVWKIALEGASNARQVVLNSDGCWMIFYRTAANPFELGAGFKNWTAISYARFQADNRAENGSVLGAHLMGKIPVGTSYGLANVSNYALNPIQVFASTRKPNHVQFDQLGGSVPAVKMLPALRASAGKLFLQITYKEMKFNGTSWGDDNKFDIVDNQSTVTDLNGEQIIVGQKRVQLPYHFDRVQY